MLATSMASTQIRWEAEGDAGLAVLEASAGNPE